VLRAAAAAVTASTVTDSNGSSNGLWTRHIDPASGHAYHMNDVTGESWWEEEGVTATSETVETEPAVPAPPMQEWLEQQAVRYMYIVYNVYVLLHECRYMCTTTAVVECKSGSRWQYISMVFDSPMSPCKRLCL
jgi:hypothetical protein